MQPNTSLRFGAVIDSANLRGPPPGKMARTAKESSTDTLRSRRCPLLFAADSFLRMPRIMARCVRSTCGVTSHLPRRLRLVIKALLTARITAGRTSDTDCFVKSRSPSTLPLLQLLFVVFSQPSRPHVASRERRSSFRRGLLLRQKRRSPGRQRFQ